LFCLIEAPFGLIELAVPLALAFFPPLLLLAPRIARWLSRAHRALARRLLGQQIASPPPVRQTAGPMAWLSASLRDGPGWRAVAFLVINVPAALIFGYVTVVWWGAGIANVTYPLWWAGFRNHPATVHLSPLPALTPFGVLHISTLPGTFAAAAAGIGMVVAAPWVTRAVVTREVAMMRGLLGPGRLAQRVADLERARALAVDDSAALVRRIERDLHDGAQVRLATLAMNLGMAMDRLAADGDPDLTTIRELVGAAHGGAKDALAELRDLARGMHPPVLDNGLEDALATLAASSPIRVKLDIGIATRPTPAIETIAYFCAAELLANAVKHSGASTITITVSGDENLVVVQVADDGRGGADLARGTGLSGLAQRAGTVDGSLTVSSPPGGPTRVTVELPLHA
jgi:signal transduction histidine kinase